MRTEKIVGMVLDGAIITSPSGRNDWQVSGTKVRKTTMEYWLKQNYIIGTNQFYGEREIYELTEQGRKSLGWIYFGI